jgi:hypothetical protein
MYGLGGKPPTQRAMRGCCQNGHVGATFRKRQVDLVVHRWGVGNVWACRPCQFSRGSAGRFGTDPEDFLMKRMLSASALALAALLTSQQSAPAVGLLTCLCGPGGVGVGFGLQLGIAAGPGAGPCGCGPIGFSLGFPRGPGCGPTCGPNGACECYDYLRCYCLPQVFDSLHAGGAYQDFDGHGAPAGDAAMQPGYYSPAAYGYQAPSYWYGH